MRRVLRLLITVLLLCSRETLADRIDWDELTRKLVAWAETSPDSDSIRVLELGRPYTSPQLAEFKRNWGAYALYSHAREMKSVFVGQALVSLSPETQPELRPVLDYFRIVHGESEFSRVAVVAARPTLKQLGGRHALSHSLLGQVLYDARARAILFIPRDYALRAFRKAGFPFESVIAFSQEVDLSTVEGRGIAAHELRHVLEFRSDRAIQWHQDPELPREFRLRTGLELPFDLDRSDFLQENWARQAIRDGVQHLALKDETLEAFPDAELSRSIARASRKRVRDAVVRVGTYLLSPHELPAFAEDFSYRRFEGSPITAAQFVAEVLDPPVEGFPAPEIPGVRALLTGRYPLGSRILAQEARRVDCAFLFAFAGAR